MKGSQSQMSKNWPWVNDFKHVALQTVHRGWSLQHKRRRKSSSSFNNRSCSGVKVLSHPFQRQRGRFGLSTASGHLIIEATLFFLVLDDGWMMHHSQMWCKTSVQTCENILHVKKKKKKRDHKIKKKRANLLKTRCIMGQTGTNHALNPSSSHNFLSTLHFHNQNNDKVSQKLNEVEQAYT